MRLKKFLVAAAAIAAIAFPHVVEACPVCFGAPDSPQTKGAQAGILALLGVTVSMLAGFAGFFFIYLRRRIRMFDESNGGNY